MTCTEFKDTFKNKIIIAFVIDKYTNIFRFEVKYTTYFLRTFLAKNYPLWNVVYFYALKHSEGKLLEDGKLKKISDTADFLYSIARYEEQTPSVCKIKEVFVAPDMSRLEGKKTKITTLIVK